MNSLLRISDKIDITRYLPPFLKKDPNFRAVCDSCSWEHENIRKAILDALDQFFMERATWGLEMWERVLGIPTNPLESTEMRRNTIRLKLRQPGSVTDEFMTKLVNQYISDAQGVVLSFPSEYRIEILYHGGTILDYSKLRDAINLYIPAHIGYKLITHTVDTLCLHGAGTVQSYQKTTIDMTTNSHQQVDDTNLHIAGAVVHNYKSFSISGGVLNHG